MATWGWKLGRWALFGVVLVATLALAPRQVGGAATYVRTVGTSMAPSFDAGDLAVVREADDYGVGDVVAYRDPALHRTVLHRIVAVDGERFVFQGDNNDFLDDQRLGSEHVLGRLWLHVPRGGTAFAWLGQPLHALLFVGTLALSGGAFVRQSTSRRSRTRSRSRRRSRVALPVVSPATVVGFGVAAALFLALAGVAFLRPATATVLRSVPFTNDGSLAYTAAVADGPVYADGAIETGDPVFLRLATEIDVSYAYRFESDADHDVRGRIGMEARLTTSSGWSQTTDLTRSRPFEGDAAELDATLDLAAVQQLLREVEDATGVTGGQHLVTVVPTVELEGTVDGRPLTTSFEPEFPFVLDGLQWRPTENEPAGERFRTTGEGSVQQPAQVDRQLVGIGPGLDVSAARQVGLAAGIVLLAVTAALASLARPGRGGEAAHIKARYGRLLVPVASAGGAGQRAVIDVPTFRALARLAEHEERLVLHHVRDGRHTYLVDSGETLYRYTAKQGS